MVTGLVGTSVTPASAIHYRYSGIGLTVVPSTLCGMALPLRAFLSITLKDHDPLIL
jgi:hypothetical protein